MLPVLIPTGRYGRTIDHTTLTAMYGTPEYTAVYHRTGSVRMRLTEHSELFFLSAPLSSGLDFQ